MNWHLSHRADPRALPLADRHYSRQQIGTPQFVAPGSCLVLLTEKADALWVTSAPFAEYTRHAWAGAWICSMFRNESPILSSELIKQAVAATWWHYQARPAQGMITFIDTTKVRRKRDWGRCYRKAGFVLAKCPRHFDRVETCKACNGFTEAGLVALQLLPAFMPAALPPIGAQLGLAM